MKGAIKKKASGHNKLTDYSRYPSIYMYVGAAPEELWPPLGMFCKVLPNAGYDYSSTVPTKDLQRYGVFS